MIYFIVLFSIIAMAILSKNKKIINGYLSYCIIIITTLFAGLRYEVWSDWDMYYNYFTNMSLMYNDFEIGFVFWNKLISIFTNNYNIYLLISYFILLGIFKRIFQFADKNIYNYSFITLFAIFILPSSGFRQFIAMTIVLYSTKYIIEEKLSKFIICVGIAFLFHRTAIIFIIAYFIKNIRIDFKKISILIIVGIVFSQLNIFEKVVEFMIDALAFLPSISYRLKLYYNNLASTEGILSFGFIRKSLVLFYLLYIKVKSNNLKYNSFLIVKFNNYLNLYLFGYILSLFIKGIFARVESYFYITECILFPLSLELIKNKNLRIIVLGIFICMYIFIFTLKLKSFYPELYIPYKSIL